VEIATAHVLLLRNPPRLQQSAGLLRRGTTGSWSRHIDLHCGQGILRVEIATTHVFLPCNLARLQPFAGHSRRGTNARWQHGRWRDFSVGASHARLRRLRHGKFVIAPGDRRVLRMPLLRLHVNSRGPLDHLRIGLSGYCPADELRLLHVAVVRLFLIRISVQRPRGH